MPKGTPKHRHWCNGMTVHVHPFGEFAVAMTRYATPTLQEIGTAAENSHPSPMHVDVKENCPDCGQTRTKVYDVKDGDELLKLVESFEWPPYSEPKVKDRMRELEADGFDVVPGAKGAEEPKKRRGRPPKEQPKRRGRPPKDRSISTHEEDLR